MTVSTLASCSPSLRVVEVSMASFASPSIILRAPDSRGLCESPSVYRTAATSTMEATLCHTLISSPMITAQRSVPEEFELAGGWLGIPTQRSQLRDSGQADEVELRATCDCTLLVIEAGANRGSSQSRSMTGDATTGDRFADQPRVRVALSLRQAGCVAW